MAVMGINMGATKISSAVNLLNPEMIVLDGGIFHKCGEKFPDAIYAGVLKWGHPASMRQVKLVCLEQGQLAGLFGTVYFALQSETKQLAHE